MMYVHTVQSIHLKMMFLLCYVIAENNTHGSMAIEAQTNNPGSLTLNCVCYSYYVTSVMVHENS